MEHGHFFKFVKYLLTYEYSKAREFDLLIKSGGSTGPAKKRSYKQRSDKIAEASEELEKGKISAAIFLNRMAYADNNICSDLDDFSCVDDPRPENDNCDLFEDDEEATPTPSQSDAALRLSPCCVCLDNVSQVTLYPCGHLKVCEDCWTKLVNTYDANLAKFLERDLEEEYRPKLKCPCCNTLIENYCKTFT
ncbi:baculoviral IAP repeat-containing protein 3-like [Sitodiplosis mosellana]|uniref:baculoviral IAP repeat-containing protein 3-like n=1 Tax=Sitodiplosis mosellana TaxID=263140 RepID=UPI002444EB7E|nr:baculoviral IAP repeat-containing protein 3-like [Sitodiplosis mosellana]